MPASAAELEKRIDAISATPANQNLGPEARDIVSVLLDALEEGSVRAAAKDPSTGEWRAVPWVKRGILLGFRAGAIVDMSLGGSRDGVVLAFFDKDMNLRSVFIERPKSVTDLRAQKTNEIQASNPDFGPVVHPRQ